jgi:desulfoferrodoxin (superoxide reductase-like protein)
MENKESDNCKRQETCKSEINEKTDVNQEKKIITIQVSEDPENVIQMDVNISLPNNNTNISHMNGPLNYSQSHINNPFSSLVSKDNGYFNTS